LLLLLLPVLHLHCDLKVLLDDLKDAVRGFTRWLSAALGFLDSRNAGMVALLDRQAKELARSSQVGGDLRGMMTLLLYHTYIWLHYST
jgi:hypothetical protein